MSLRQRLRSAFARREAGQGFELAVATLLGIAAVATAFAAYKSSLDGGASATAYNEGIALNSLAAQSNLEGNQEFTQDQAIFLEFVKATQTDDEDLAAYIQTQLMSDNLRSGVEWWADTGDEYPTPFTDDNPKYEIQGWVEGAKYDELALRRFDDGERLGTRGDRYTLVTVILAAALFMLGVAAVARAWAVKLGFCVVGAAFLVASLVQTGRILWG